LIFIDNANPWIGNASKGASNQFYPCTILC